MRSQLDCHDSRLPGTGVFDIKTRACLPIRLDLLNFEVSQSVPMPPARLNPLDRRIQDILFAPSLAPSKASRRNIMI
jgi:hypothetical protein